VTAADATREVEHVIALVRDDFASGDERGVVVDSPPGAGKSTLVVQVATDLAAAGERVMVVAQTNEQVDDLVARMATMAPTLHIGRLSATNYLPTGRVLTHANVTIAESVADLHDPLITIGTAAKWLYIDEPPWPWAIIDEAYQMRSDMLLRIAARFRRALFVGDPGQLDPFSTIDIDRWAGLTWDPMQSAVAALLRNNPAIPIHQLPVSWRLPASAAPAISEAFYPFGGFRSATADGERRLTFQAGGFGQASDQALETAARTGWALYELPARFTVRTDIEATMAAAHLAVRALHRGTVTHSEQTPDGTLLTANRVAIGATHRDQVAELRNAVGRAGGEGITVDTANRLQGSEFDLVVVLHPLSGRRDATAFHLESGRLCVLTSRHRHACIVVARSGIQELLDAHPSTEPMHLNVPARFPDGWEAHQAMLTNLSQHRVHAG
jgi:AAA domain